MKQTGGLYPAPLKILEVSLVVIIIFNADLALPVPNFPVAVYPQNHELLQYYWFIGVRRLDG